MTKKLFILALSIMFLTNNTYAVTGLKDMNKHWSKTYVDRLYKEGYVKGSNGNFYPEQALKTEDFLIMVVKVLDPNAKTLSADVGASYYAPYIQRAKELGLIKAEFDEVPQYIERSMPRELAVQVIDRALTIKGENIAADHGLEYKFKDYDIINDINKEPVLRAYQLGIIKGSKGNFEPKNLLTRAESAVLISKLLDKSLRDQLTVFKNPNTYGKIDQWYLELFEKYLPKRSVVIEKKLGGIINTGDVDYTEKSFFYNGKWHSWWTDQAFEDKILNDIDKSIFTYSASLAGNPNLRTDDILGYYFAHNGEIAYINEEDNQSLDAKRYYTEYPSTNNMNRIMYDLSKYGAQFATLSGTFHTTGKFMDTINFIMSGTSNINGSGQLGFGFYQDPVDLGKFLKCDYPVAFRMDANNYTIAKYKPLMNQVFIRIYGSTDGPAVFSKAQSMIKGKDVGMAFDTTAVVNGVHIRASADKDTGIVFWFSMKPNQ